MTADEAAFLARIREEPDADLPRLVFADYLEEQGHEARAQFIRAQIELASLTEDSPRRRELAWFCRPTVESTAKQWYNAPKGYAGSAEHLANPFAFARPRLVRGLIEYAEFWLESAKVVKAAFRHMPLRRAWLSDREAVPSLIEAIPADNCLRVLDLTGNGLDGHQLQRALADNSFPRLAELVLTGCNLRDRDIGPLTQIAVRHPLMRLHLGANPFTFDGRRRLRDTFGERVTFECEGDPDRLYPLEHSTGRFTVGFAPDLTQHLVLVGPYEVSLAHFDHAGNVLRLDVTPHDYTADTQTKEREVLDKLGHTPAMIRVKRFQFPDETGVTPFESGWLTVLDDPLRDGHGDARRWLAEWLDRGRFVWQHGQGHMLWVDDDGVLTDL